MRSHLSILMLFLATAAAAQQQLPPLGLELLRFDGARAGTPTLQEHVRALEGQVRRLDRYVQDNAESADETTRAYVGMARNMREILEERRRQASEVLERRRATAGRAQGYEETGKAAQTAAAAVTGGAYYYVKDDFLQGVGNPAASPLPRTRPTERAEPPYTYKDEDQQRGAEPPRRSYPIKGDEQ